MKGKYKRKILKLNNHLLKSPEVQRFISTFESFLKTHINSLNPLPLKGHQVLFDSIKYSLFSGGKFFRPLLIFSVSRILSINPHDILPWAGAIEMIHVASLIHDDLPLMDNSLQRRGKVTNHRRFGPDMALLAGNCLWIEAFKLLESDQKASWLPILCKAVGFKGLMGGQALDLKPPPIFKQNDFYYNHLHSMKTAALISASIEGVLVLSKQKTEEHQRLQTMGQILGLAFQLADDLQDRKEDITVNWAVFLGKKKALKKLHELTQDSLNLIDSQNPSTQLLKQLVLFNYERTGIESNAAG